MLAEMAVAMIALLILSQVHTASLWYCTFWIGSTRDGQSWLAFLMQVSCRKVRNMMRSGVGV